MCFKFKHFACHFICFKRCVGFKLREKLCNFVGVSFRRGIFRDKLCQDLFYLFSAGRSVIPITNNLKYIYDKQMRFELDTYIFQIFLLHKESKSRLCYSILYLWASLQNTIVSPDNLEHHLCHLQECLIQMEYHRQTQTVWS